MPPRAFVSLMRRVEREPRNFTPLAASGILRSLFALRTKKEEEGPSSDQKQKKLIDALVRASLFPPVDSASTISTGPGVGKAIPNSQVLKNMSMLLPALVEEQWLPPEEANHTIKRLMQNLLNELECFRDNAGGKVVVNLVDIATALDAISALKKTERGRAAIAGVNGRRPFTPTPLFRTLEQLVLDPSAAHYLLVLSTRSDGAQRSLLWFISALASHGFTVKEPLRFFTALIPYVWEYVSDSRNGSPHVLAQLIQDLYVLRVNSETSLLPPSSTTKLIYSDSASPYRDLDEAMKTDQLLELFFTRFWHKKNSGVELQPRLVGYVLAAMARASCSTKSNSKQKTAQRGSGVVTEENVTALVRMLLHGGGGSGYVRKRGYVTVSDVANHIVECLVPLSELPPTLTSRVLRQNLVQVREPLSADVVDAFFKSWIQGTEQHKTTYFTFMCRIALAASALGLGSEASWTSLCAAIDSNSRGANGRQAYSLLVAFTRMNIGHRQLNTKLLEIAAKAIEHTSPSAITIIHCIEIIYSQQLNVEKVVVERLVKALVVAEGECFTRNGERADTVAATALRAIKIFTHSTRHPSFDGRVVGILAATLNRALAAVGGSVKLVLRLADVPIVLRFLYSQGPLSSGNTASFSGPSGDHFVYLRKARDLEGRIFTLLPVLIDHQIAVDRTTSSSNEPAGSATARDVVAICSLFGQVDPTSRSLSKASAWDALQSYVERDNVIAAILPRDITVFLSATGRCHRDVADSVLESMYMRAAKAPVSLDPAVMGSLLASMRRHRRALGLTFERPTEAQKTLFDRLVRDIASKKVAYSVRQAAMLSHDVARLFLSGGYDDKDNNDVVARAVSNLTSAVLPPERNAGVRILDIAMSLWSATIMPNFLLSPHSIISISTLHPTIKMILEQMTYAFITNKTHSLPDLKLMTSSSRQTSTKNVDPSGSSRVFLWSRLLRALSSKTMFEAARADPTLHTVTKQLVELIISEPVTRVLRGDIEDVSFQPLLAAEALYAGHVWGMSTAPTTSMKLWCQRIVLEFGGNHACTSLIACCGATYLRCGVITSNNVPPVVLQMKDALAANVVEWLAGTFAFVSQSRRAMTWMPLGEIRRQLVDDDENVKFMGDGNVKKIKIALDNVESKTTQ
eukprot:PhM_4_TR15640/c0_g1_i2/m.43847